jgi:ATP-dependent DNA helicase RecG
MREILKQDSQNLYFLQIGQALELEKKLGFQNNSVIGGLSNHISRLLNESFQYSLKVSIPKDFLNFASLYQDSSKSKRSQIISELEKLLNFDSKKLFSGNPPKKIAASNQVALRGSVRYQKYVGAATASKLKRLKVGNIGDLLHHFPFRYLDTSSLKRISEVKEGEEATVIGLVKDVRKFKSKRGTHILNIGIYDGTAYLYGVWFNQDYIAEALKEGKRAAFSGKIAYRFGQLQIENPFYDIIDDEMDIDQDTVHTNRIIPFHPATQNLSSSRIRRIVKHLVDVKTKFPDPLPTSVKSNFGYLSKSLCLREIHFPTTMELYEKARSRLVFEELFLIQVGLALKKVHFEQQTKGIEHKISNSLVKEFYSSLPFELTDDQKKVISEIQTDMTSPKPMNRLLQGEVGSGKTVVALATLLTTVENGFQGAIMAPTEVLAEQHFRKIKSFLKSSKVNVALLTGSLSPKEKAQIQDKITRGEVDIVVGTHTLVQETVTFKNLGAAVIDEQHRFGVRQRINLKKKGVYPDVLIMTATPIPRTLALTLYGDLDVSAIKQLPLGRKLSEHVKTYICDRNHRSWAYEKIRSEVKKGRQAYIVCPLIEESDKLQVKAVAEETERLENEIFPDLKVALIHGRLRPSEKEQVMQDFQNGLIDILISTTVIEVGIDVPNASVMLIEDADRFGLSQLHQLRGRIGRGEHKSYCILFADPNTDEGKARMEAIKEISDGFKLAEADLEIRGEGQIFGTRQSGVPDLKLARLTQDLDVLLSARKEAFKIVQNDFSLKSVRHKLLLFEVKERFASRLDWLFHS